MAERMEDDLIGFLRARLDEDERVALAAAAEGALWNAVGSPGLLSAGVWAEDATDPAVPVVHDEGSPSRKQADHIARWDPARALIEVQARRRLVDHLELAWPRLQAINTWGPTDMGELAGNVLQLLALPYASHPDYRADWGPDVWRDPREGSRG